MGMDFLSEPRRKIPWSLTILKAILVGLHRSAAHFLHAQGSHGAVVVLRHFQNQNARGKKLFNPIGGIVFARGGRCEVMKFVVARLD